MSLEATIEQLAPAVLRYCRASLRDWALAEDVAQEALVALVRRWRGAGPPGDPAAFVFTVARRRARRAAWRARLLAPLDNLLGVASRDPGADEQVARRAELQFAWDAIARLSMRERDALLLVAVAGLDHAAAARSLGIGMSALKMRLSRARRHLRGGREVQHAVERG